MSRSSHHKEKYRIKSEVFLVHCNEGTSARTRPFTFEDIMLRRKSKKAGETQVASGDSERRDYNIETSLDDLETDVDRNRQSFGGGSNPLPEDLRKVSSKRKESNFHGVDEGKLTKQKDKSREELNLKTKSNTTVTKDLSRKNNPPGKSDGDVQNRKRYDHRNEDSRDESGRNRLGDSRRNEISAEKTYGKSVNEREHNRGIDEDQKRVYSRRRDVDPSRHEHRNDRNKRLSRESDWTEKYADMGGRELDKDSRAKRQIEDKKKIQDSYVNKLGVHKSSDLSESKEVERSTIHHEESSRKRRSGSGEHSKDRSRRSSLSPRAHKRMSLGDKSYSSKDKNQKLHIDSERKRILNNGSNGNQRRYSGSSSGLGGYSPRKRKTEAAAKTPSPANRSPEHRTAGWDHPVTQKDRELNDSFVSDVQSASQPASDNGPKPDSMILDTSVAVRTGVNLPYTPSSQIHAIDSIQLTQATRPMRRLYVENLPSSASEKIVLECVNDFLLSSGVNHIKGTLPCISCMINKEKNQALLEFLTPEDASAALSMDGKFLSGSVLKIKRPKDFIEPTTAVRDNTTDETHYVSDKVEDTSHKIFIGRISKLISSQMLMKIAEAFGPLKAFHFEHDKDIDVHYAFLEYVDHLVTQKACAGLNGMKLGGQILTVIQATPHVPSLENADQMPFYGIPEHAKPLLKSPTRVLKLKNMLDTGGISIMSEADLEETLEDVKLECARFGAVKSVNIIKHFNDSMCGKAAATLDCGVADVNHDHDFEEVRPENNNHDLAKVSKPFNCITKDVEVDGSDKSCVISDGDPSISNKTTVGNSLASVEVVGEVLEDQNRELVDRDKDEIKNETACEEIVDLPSRSCRNPLVKNEHVPGHPVESSEMENKSTDAERSMFEEERVGISTTSEPDTHCASQGQKNEQGSFEVGCVLVEFKREEASCMAAHFLHGRLYDDRVVTVEYVDPDLYHRRFSSQVLS